MMRLYIILMPRSLCVCVHLGVTFTLIFIINYYYDLFKTCCKELIQLGHGDYKLELPLWDCSNATRHEEVLSIIMGKGISVHPT